MKLLLSILALGMAACACAQQQTGTGEQDIEERIAEAELDLERLKLSLAEMHPAVVVAEREIWELESQLPPEARSSALQARIDAEQRRLESLMASGESEEDSAVRLSRDRLLHLEELLVSEAN